MYNDSTSISGKVSSGSAALINAISKFPQEWALAPCVGKKNLWPNWNKAKLDRAALIQAIRSQTNHEGKKTLWTGVSIVTGPLSHGIMAVDFDGPLAWKKYLELSGDRIPPMTKHWTSGKPGHFQILLSVSPEKWENLAAVKYFILDPAPRLELGLSLEAITEAVETTVENIEQWESGTTSPIPPAIAKKLVEIYGCSGGELCQKLELRWNECSTLPPSIHPDTGKPYRWENNGEVAKCPDFILDLMREVLEIEIPHKPKPENPTYIDADRKSLVDIYENEILPRLDAEEFYGSYLKLKSAGKNLKALCPFHAEKTASFSVTPSEKTFHCFGCGTGGGPVQFLYQLNGGTGSPTGKDFYGVVMELADRVGVRMPDRKFQQNPESKIQHPIRVLQEINDPKSTRVTKDFNKPFFQV
ncbi:CHC2 zinc finger domain-containing protein, partial [Microcoleus sp. B3-A4]|uniref:CHC2 zinc finger domain-containing protein n=1 Tax=Microcoleus sp. B3-A4 TaxID=2818653 RepID=UPI002FD674C5